MKRKLPLLMPTASSLERAEHCPTSFTLAQVIETNEDAERGTEIHLFSARVLSGVPKDDALALVKDKEIRATCAGLDFTKMVGDLDGVRAEVAYAFNTETRAVRELGVGLERKYEVTEAEIPGTNDAEGMRISGIAVTGDLKSGFGNTIEPETSRQSHYHAVVRRRALDVDFVDARIWRVGESGKVKAIEHTFDGFALDTLEDELVDIFAGVKSAHERMQAGDTLKVHPGSWCSYCPAKPVCPAHVALAREMLPELERVGGLIAGVMRMTPAEQFRVFELWHQAKKLVEAIGPSLKAIAKHAPFVSADGTQMVKNISYEKENFSKELAVLLLKQKGASAEELASLYSFQTIESVRMVKVKGAKKPKAA